MSQLPRLGGPKSVSTSTSRTSRIPGTNTTITQTETRVTEVADCKTGPESRARVGGGRPCGSELRPPSQRTVGIPGPSLRPMASAASGPPASCSVGTYATSTPRPPGVPQIRIQPPADRPAQPYQGLPQPRPPQGLSLLRPPPVLTQPRPMQGLPQPRSCQGLPQPRPAQGIPQPRPAQGLPQPRPAQGLPQPRPAQGLPQPRPTQGLPQPRSAQGLSRVPQSLPQPRPPQALPQGGPCQGLSRARPAQGLPQPRPVQGPAQLRPPQGLPRLRPGLPQPFPQPRTSPPQRGAPCASPCASPPGRAAPEFQHTPVQRRSPQDMPGAPQRRTARPTGPEAYKLFDFEGKYKLKKPSSSMVMPPCPKGRQKGKSSAGGMEEIVHTKLLEKASGTDDKVTAKAGRVTITGPEYIQTPAGREPLIQQTTLERRVERDEEGERIVKNLEVIDLDADGRGKRLEMGIQQLDPTYARDEGKEVIGITSTVSITEGYTTVSKEVSRAVTETLPEGAQMAPEEVAKLVAEETEDVENTLKMLPPDIALSPGRYEMKKRLQTLRLNSESVALLEQAIIHPEPNADEAQAEPSPEMMASMMNTVEKGVPPKSTPDQVFNSLFEETTNERFIQLSPVTQGPLQDVVVPTEISYEVHKEVLTNDMAKLTEKLQGIQTAEEIPYVDIFTTVMDDMKKSPTKGKNKEISYQPISDEKSLWVNANLERLVNVVGAQPAEILDPANVEELEAEGNLEQEMGTGMEYFVDVDPIQYMSRVQLRGTELPSYFPGYMVALPEFSDVIKLAKSPDEVFASAWKSVQPKYFPDESMQSLIY